MSDAAIADLTARVKMLEAHAKQARKVPGEIGGLSAKVRTLETAEKGLETKLEELETTLRQLKKGLKARVGDLETKVYDPEKGLEGKVEGLEVTVRDQEESLEAKVEGVKTTMLAEQDSAPVPPQVQDLTGKVSRIEGQISMAMWLGPVVVAVIALVIQSLT